MNEYTYQDIKIGQEERFSVMVTEKMQEGFLQISGDNNPMHVNEQYAKDKGFGGKLVYGMVTAAFYSTLVGVHLPGKYCLFQEADIKFCKPVFVGDTLEIVGHCAEKNDLFKRIIIKAKIYNQNKTVVSSAILRVGTLDE